MGRFSKLDSCTQTLIFEPFLKFLGCNQYLLFITFFPLSLSLSLSLPATAADGGRGFYFQNTHFICMSMNSVGLPIGSWPFAVPLYSCALKCLFTKALFPNAVLWTTCAYMKLSCTRKYACMYSSVYTYNLYCIDCVCVCVHVCVL